MVIAEIQRKHQIVMIHQEERIFYIQNKQILLDNTGKEDPEICQYINSGLPFTEAGVNITSSSPLGDTMRSLLFEAKYTSLSIQLRYLRSPFPVSKVSGRREKAHNDNLRRL